MTTVRFAVQRALVAASLSLMLSCIPTFENPLPGPSEEAYDCRLLGSWVSGDGGAQVLFYPADKGWVEMISMEGIGGGGALPMKDLFVADCFTSVVRGAHYLCIRPRGSSRSDCPRFAFSLSSEFLIVQYEISEAGILEIRHLDEPFLVRAIETKKLAGTVEESGSAKTPHVTASGEELAAFFAASDPAALADREDPVVLKLAEPLDLEDFGSF